MDGSTARTCMHELWCGVVRCIACRSVPDSIFLQKKPTLLADEWSAAKCAAWKIAVMSLIDGSDSQVYKRKLKDVKKAAIKKALKRRKTVRKQADV